MTKHSKLIVATMSIFLIAGQVAAQISSKLEMGDLKINCSISKMKEVRTFYKEILGARVVTPDSPIPRDYIQFDDDKRINIIYLKGPDDLLTKEEALMAPWIRVFATDFEHIYERVKSTDTQIIKENYDQKELYVQAPDFQVYRISGR